MVWGLGMVVEMSVTSRCGDPNGLKRSKSF